MADLNENDIGEIEYGKRLGYILPVFIICFAALWNAYYCFTTETEKNLELLVLVDGGVVLLSVLVPYWVNRKANRDMEMREKIVKLAQVTHKEAKVTHGAGSASIAPGYWGVEMNGSVRYDLIIDNYRYEVEKGIFDQVEAGDFVEMHYAKHSGRLLRIDLRKEKTSRF